MTFLTIDVSVPEAESVAVTDDTLTAELSDGRSISVPLAWNPRLAHAAPHERRNWRLIGGGEGVHWPDLDEDISVEGLLAGRPTGESQRSLKRWLATRTAGQHSGISPTRICAGTSAARVTAAREFRAKCLGLIVEVAESGREIVTTKRGKLSP